MGCLRVRAGETLRLQFPREDLGFVYHRGALAGSVYGVQQGSPQQEQQQVQAQQQQQEPLPGRLLLGDAPKQPSERSGGLLGSAEVLPPGRRGSPYVPCSAPGAHCCSHGTKCAVVACVSLARACATWLLVWALTLAHDVGQYFRHIGDLGLHYRFIGDSGVHCRCIGDLGVHYR